MDRINGVFKLKLKRAMAIILAFAMVITLFPAFTQTAKAETAASNTNAAFRVTTYDTSARIEVPYDSTATNYKVYMSTSSGLTDFSGAACVLNSNTYKPYVYVLNYDADALVPSNHISISPNTTYYFYLVINDGTTSAAVVSAKTASTAQYWTSPGNYDTSWYDGSASSFNIKTAKQLAGFSVLVNGLNGVSAANFSGKTVHLTASLDMSQYLWKPIGSDSNPFNGTFDGGNYDVSSNYIGSNVIKGLHTNNSTFFDKYQGLFGYNTNIIRNIGMVDGYINGFDRVGGITAFNSGTVENCFNTGTVTGTGSWIGGITGQNAGTGIIENCYNTGNIACPDIIKIGGIAGENNGKIINSYNTGSISGGENTAGIAGYAWGGVISNSYNSGSVNGTQNYTGGIAGSAAGITVTNCYNIGNINGQNRTGGITGGFNTGFDGHYAATTISNSYNLGEVDSVQGSSGGITGYLLYGTIQNSYNAGVVNGNANINTGSIVGYIETPYGVPTVLDCAYLTGTAVYGIGNRSDTTGASDDAAGILYIIQNDTANVWTASPSVYGTGGMFSAGNPVNQGYPVLCSFGYTDGTIRQGFSPDITINSSTGAITVGASYGDGTSSNPYIIRNIYQMDLMRKYSGKAFKLACNLDISPAEYNKVQDTNGSWSPIGTSISSETFDGNGFSVSGIYINSSSDSKGLFGSFNGTIKNIGITNGYVKGNNNVGSLCGYSYTVQNSYNTGVVIANGFSGGVAGTNYSMLENSYNTGSITGTNQQVGGVVGFGESSMMNNYNIGSVKAVTVVGGVVGVSSSGTITNNYNTGAVFAGSTAGGVIGYNESTLSNCFNTGDVNCANTAGGIAASSSVSLSNCYNTGIVSGSDFIGGITGQLISGTISSSYNTGAVSGNDRVGGVAGSLNSGTISNTYYYGCGQGVGSGSQDGTTPFVKMNKSSINIGETTAVTEQTAFDITWKTALGADFNINYTRPYTASPSGTADITGTSITGEAAGSASINGSFTINQNSLTSAGFTGEAQQIIVPVSMALSVEKAVPTVTVSPISDSIVGDTITLIASITNGASPTGTVTFKNGETTIGTTSTITGGAAQVSYTTSAAGSLSITAEYSGDANNEAAVSASVAGTVNHMQPALTLSASPASPGTYPNDVIFTAALSNVYNSVSGQTITFNIDGTDYTASTDGSGVATYTLTAPSVKDYTVTASFAGDVNNYSVTSSSLTYNVNKGTQSDLTIGGVPGTITYGDAAFTLVPSGGSGTGAVTYTVEAGKDNVLTVDSSGKVTIVGAGTAKITVTKAGDTNYNPTSKDVTITVAPKTLDVTITPDNKIYDGTTDAAIKGNISYNGIVGSDDVCIAGGTIKFSDKTAANGKTVTASGYSLSGTKSADYSLGTITVNTADITPKPVTVSGTEVKDKTYDGTTAAEFSGTPSVFGILSGDTVTFSPGTPTFAGKDYSVAAIPVTFSSFSLGGADAVNYSLTQPSPTSAKINKKILNVSVDPVVIKCGQQIPPLDVIVNAGDFVAGENEANVAGFAKPAASQSYGSTTTPVSNTSIAVTYNGGNSTNNYGFNYNYSTQLTIQSVNVSNGDYQVTGSYSTSDNPSGWNNSALTVTPKNGYDLISTDGTNWTSNLQAQTEGTDKSVTFKLKKSSDGTQTENTTIYYNLDKTVPTGTVTIDTNTWKDFLNTITFGLFSNKTVDVSITGADSLSGVKTIEYQKVASESDYDPNGTWTPYSAFSVSPDEKFIVYARITDDAGNVTIINSNGVVVDDNAPTITATYGSDNVWTTDANAKISVAVTENLAGIKEIYYTIDGGSAIAAAGNSFDITSLKDGNYVVAITATDNAGNSTVKNVTVKKDTAVPTISVSGDTADYIKNDKVNILAAAGTSGIAKVEVQKDGGAWADITLSYALGYNVILNGTYTFRVTNGAGTANTAAITYNKLDSTKPVLSINSNGYTEDTWTKDAVTLDITNTASNIGPITYEVSTNGTDYTTFNGEYKISSDSSLTYYFRGTSASGVVSDVKSFKAKLDKTVPTGTVTIDTNTWKDFLSTITFGLFYSKTVDVSITGADNLSGVKTIEYQKVASESDYAPNGTWTPYSAFSVSPDEKFIVYARITDNAGNYVIINSDGVIVDATKPVLTLTPDTNDWTKNNVNVKVTTADALAGLKEVTYTTDESVPQTGTVSIVNGQGTITLTNEGQYKLTVTAKDNSLNEVSEITNIKIDRTKPIIAGANNSSSYFIGRVIKLTDNIGEIAEATYKNGTDTATSFKDGDLFEKPGNYTLTVVDKAGNSNTLSFEIKPLPKVEDVVYTTDCKVLIDSIRDEFISHDDLPEPYKTDMDNQIKALEARYSQLVTELYDANNDLTVMGIDGTFFTPNVYLVVTPISGRTNESQFKSASKEVENASKYTSKLQGKELLALYDVSLFRDNIKIQPDGNVKVKIKIPEELRNRTGLDIVHIADDGTVTPMNAAIEGGHLVFTTNHFSEYAIVAKSIINDIPKTGSVVDFNSLIIVGILLNLIGIVLIRKKVKRIKRT